MSAIRISLWRKQDGVCSYCKRPVPVEDATVDHVVPRCRGGKTHAGNIVMACRDCNECKGDLPVGKFLEMLNDPMVFADRRARLSDARLEMWRRADALRCSALQPPLAGEVNG